MSLILADVTSITPLTMDIMRVMLRPHTFIPYHAGQYLEIVCDDASYYYSIANAPHPEEGYELHFRHTPGHEKNEQVFNQLQTKHALQLEVPHGVCHSGRLNDELPVVCIAGGTGYAPIHAMVQQWIESGSKQAMTVWWSVRSAEDLYMDAQLKSWYQQIKSFHYCPYISSHETKSFIDCITAAHGQQLTQSQVVLSGPFDLVYSTRDLLLQLGVPLENMLSDAFEFEGR